MAKRFEQVCVLGIFPKIQFLNPQKRPKFIFGERFWENSEMFPKWEVCKCEKKELQRSMRKANCCNRIWNNIKVK